MSSPQSTLTSESASKVHIAGSVERVTYHNSENGYCVARVKVKGQKDLVTLVGHINSITPGEFVESTGEWTNHRDFGVQFKAEFIKTVHPSTIEGIEKYLGSGMVKHCNERIKLAVHDTQSMRARRRAKRNAIYAVLEEFGLVRRYRGGQLLVPSELKV